MSSKTKKTKEHSGDGPITELNPWPEYIQERNVLWDKLKAAYDAEIAAKTPCPIDVTLPDGKIMSGESWRTSPYMIAKQIRWVISH